MVAEAKVTLPDQSVRTYPVGTTFRDIAFSIGRGLGEAALAVKFEGRILDLSRALDRDGALEIVTGKSDAGLEVIRHSTAHVLAMAVQRLWPGTQVTIGPVIDNGFYYDFAFPAGVVLSDADFPRIEEVMRQIVGEDFPVTRSEKDRAHWVETFSSLGEKFKVEIIQDLPAGEPISVYSMGPWFDLCRGPHVPSTGKLGAFKLTAIAGSYWRGDEKRAQLTRIYGTAWASKKDLEEYLARVEEAKRRDHRILGKQLDLFSFHRESPANPFFHPNGQKVYDLLQRFMRASNTRFGIEEVGTPLIMNVDLWRASGHYENYRENMYFTHVDETEAAVKPMNCPGHCLIFKSMRHSYRELPIRFGEFGRVHRHERSGVTHGLMRVRSFIQDDGHVFCTDDQIGDEVSRILQQVGEVYSRLGFQDYRIELSTRPAKSIGTDTMWNRAESELQLSLQKAGLPFQVNQGDGAFYGPKIDFHLIDSLGRSWQCGTVQLDFSMPERFGLEYVGSDDKPHTPVMLHRAILGSFERFLGVLIEHTAGHFPLWLAPVQARVLTVSEHYVDYAEGVLRELKGHGARVVLDARSEKLGYKIREAQLLKTPYMIIIGDKEQQKTRITVRLRDGSNREGVTISDFIGMLEADCGPQWRLVSV